MIEDRKVLGDWMPWYLRESEKEYFGKLQEFLEKEYRNFLVYPPRENILYALIYTQKSQIKVVILGQDPYHDDGQAHGLSFSVRDGVALPPSLRNIYKELNSDLGCEIPTSGDLSQWAQQGVLLLNTVLTVRAHEAHSHRKQGWEQFTDSLIQEINDINRPIVFVLWGAPAQKKRTMLTNENHLVLCAPHPSPLSSYRGFFGSQPFSQVNDYLIDKGCEPLNCSILM